MGKKVASFPRMGSRRLKKPAASPSPPMGGAGSPSNNDNNNSLIGGGGGGLGKGKKKTGGARLWMRFDRSGLSELVECDKSAIIQRAGIPARDLRILGPVFSHSSNILGNTIPLFFSFMNFISGMVFSLGIYLSASNEAACGDFKRLSILFRKDLSC